MPAYLISHRSGQHGDIHIEDDALTVDVILGWATFRDAAGGIALAIPSDQVASIQRIDADAQGQENSDGPAPEG